MMEKQFSHLPVLLAECIDGLRILKDGCYLDGTVGGGGHSESIAEGLSESGTLFCLDKDPDAICAATARLKRFSNVRVIEGDFRDVRRLIPEDAPPFDGALLDLGVSSHQLDAPERGFSYRSEGALDMRMAKAGQSAGEMVNTATEEELISVLRDYGEEPYAGSIARKISFARGNKPIETTTELADIVTSALPPAVRRKEKNPARKTFMALRIAVNDELEALKEGMEDIFHMMARGGRLCVITFHSIEDRIVKQYFMELATGCTCPPEFPVCVCGKTPRAARVTKKPIVASEAEAKENRRARSAKLRIIEKL